MISTNYTTKFGSVTITSSTKNDGVTNGMVNYLPLQPLIKTNQVALQDVIPVALASHETKVSREHRNDIRKLSQGKLELSKTDIKFLRSMGIAE